MDPKGRHKKSQGYEGHQQGFKEFTGAKKDHKVHNDHRNSMWSIQK